MIHPSIHSLSLPTVEEVLKGSTYVVFGVVTALNMSAMLLNVLLFYIKVPLYIVYTQRLLTIQNLIALRTFVRLVQVLSGVCQGNRKF